MAGTLLWIKRWIRNCRRVVKQSKRPTSKEYWGTSRITLFGIAILGTLGYIISLLINVLVGVTTS